MFCIFNSNKVYIYLKKKTWICLWIEWVCTTVGSLQTLRLTGDPQVLLVNGCESEGFCQSMTSVYFSKKCWPWDWLAILRGAARLHGQSSWDRLIVVPYPTRLSCASSCGGAGLHSELLSLSLRASPPPWAGNPPQPQSLLSLSYFFCNHAAYGR